MNHSILKIPALKEMLKKNKLSLSGNKADLIKRLDDFHGKSGKSGQAGKSDSKKKVRNQQQNTVNIYVGEGQAQKVDDAKNVFISSGLKTMPFLPTGNNPTMQSSSSVKHPVVIPANIVKYSGIPLRVPPSTTVIGQEEEKVIEKPLPKKLNLSSAFKEKLSKAIGKQ